ncbi:hypothetical protein [Pseudooceanicola spongiae]|nr:hypothetical protein [Pseudooceanicola spongiae]
MPLDTSFGLTFDDVGPDRLHLKQLTGIDGLDLCNRAPDVA